MRDERARTRFAREAQALAAARHPNVVAIHETGLEGEVPWFSMDLLEGQTLAVALAPGRLPLARALELALGLASGVEALHRAGVVHRDLKPDNVIVAASARSWSTWGSPSRPSRTSASRARAPWSGRSPTWRPSR